MTREESSTGFGRVFVDESRLNDCREVYLNRDQPTQPKIAPGIQSTVYPTQRKPYATIEQQLIEIH